MPTALLLIRSYVLETRRLKGLHYAKIQLHNASPSSLFHPLPRSCVFLFLPAGRWNRSLYLVFY